MPQLIALTVLGAGLWAGYRWYRRQVKQVADELRAAEEALRKREESAIPTLQQDPDTGVYRPTSNRPAR